MADAPKEEENWLQSKRVSEAQWEDVQKKTFCAWVNLHLHKAGTRIANLETDFSDGVKLIALLQVLHGSPIEGRYYKNPKSKPYKIDNVNFALNFITDTLKVRLISCSAEDIVDGNIKIILGMCWRLIQKFLLPEEHPRQFLLNWVKSTIGSICQVENFHKSFDDGYAFCALMHAYNPKLLDIKSVHREDKLRNLAQAFNIAEESLEISQLLDPADICLGIVDERSIMTYLALIHNAFLEKGVGPAVKEPTTPKTTAKVPEVLDDGVRERLAQLDKKVTQLLEQQTEYQATISSLTERNESLVKELTASQETLQSSQKIVKDLEQQLEKASNSPVSDDSTSTRTVEVKEEQVSEAHPQGDKEEPATSPNSDAATVPADSESIQKQLEETRANLQQQINVGETLQKSLEDAREELGLLQKKHKKAIEKALKKQQKRHEKRIQRRDKELEAVKKNARTELQQKNDEIKRLKEQLSKAQVALGDSAVQDTTDAIDEDIAALKMEFEEIRAMSTMLLDEEGHMMRKAAKPVGDDEHDDEEGEEE